MTERAFLAGAYKRSYENGVRREVNQRILDMLAVQDPQDMTGYIRAMRTGRGAVFQSSKSGGFIRLLLPQRIPGDAFFDDPSCIEAQQSFAKYLANASRLAEGGAPAIEVRDKNIALDFSTASALEASLNHGIEDEKRHIRFPNAAKLLVTAVSCAFR